jgi:hypothetical protein
MEFRGKNIIIDRELSYLDNFTLDFLKVLSKHTTYVVISGYIAILLGRSRASEDVDIIIPQIRQKEFEKFSEELEHKGFYCLNAEDKGEQYEYLIEKLALRFAYNNTVIPNIELKCAKSEFDKEALLDTLTVHVQGHEIIISNLEMQVAFKERVLKSQKDIEDARHIRNVAKLDKKKLHDYEVRLDGFY